MRTLVLGSAVSGTAAAHLAARLGHTVSVYDRSAGATIALREEGFAVHSGSWAKHVLRNVDVVVASPGFSEQSEPVRDALGAGLAVISELEFGARQLSVPYVAVTGTNGKTTVTETITEMLNRSDVPAVAAGNIGVPVCGLGDDDASVVVLEASSFQLRFIDRFRPTAAGIVNVAPDHLDWHGSEQRYTAAKGRIFENMAGRDLVVYDEGDPGASNLAQRATCRRLGVRGNGMSADSVGLDGGDLDLAGRRFALSTTDPSWIVDLAIAAVIADSVGASDAGIQAGLSGFTPGPHRRRTVASRNGVAWIDDSKATNPHAARAASAAYERVVLLAGGRNKELDLSTIAASSVRHVVAFGEAAASIERGASVPVTVVDDLAAAVSAAHSVSEPGDTVLLAPGCASFDEFDSYAARGDRFATLVAAMEMAK